VVPQKVLPANAGMKAMAERAQLSAAEVAQVSGHSTRVGACQDMVRYGVDVAATMQAGRWKTTTMVSRYREGLDLKRGAIARVAARRAQFTQAAAARWDTRCPRAIDTRRTQARSHPWRTTSAHADGRPASIPMATTRARRSRVRSGISWSIR
jgi:hypothetical protein